MPGTSAPMAWLCPVDGQEQIGRPSAKRSRADAGFPTPTKTRADMESADNTQGGNNIVARLSAINPLSMDDLEESEECTMAGASGAPTEVDSAGPGDFSPAVHHAPMAMKLGKRAKRATSSTDWHQFVALHMPTITHQAGSREKLKLLARVWQEQKNKTDGPESAAS